MDKAIMKKVQWVILILAAAFTMVGIYLALIWAPTHSMMGDVQRIFYFHVASAWVSYMAFGVTFFAGIMYMKTLDLKWDNFAAVSAELGIVFCTITITTGPLWGKAVWDVYWRWEDMKLFITLVLWLVFIAYMALRANIPSRKRRAILSGVFGIIGMICIPLSFAANRIWTQYHPTVVATEQGSLQSAMGIGLGVAVLAFSFLYVYLLMKKYEFVTLRDRIEEVKKIVGD